MEVKKKCQIHLIETNSEKPTLVLNSRVLQFANGYNPKDCSRGIDPLLGYHLYITNDEEIKEGDWVLSKHHIEGKILSNKLIIYKANKNFILNYYVRDTKIHQKIIASTDKLVIEENCNNFILQPSFQFVKKYISEYNKKNIITEALISYDEYNRSTTWEYDEPEISELKTDSDNCVIISQIVENIKEQYANCLLSICDSLKLYDNDSLILEGESLSELLFRKMKACEIDLNKDLNLNYLKPVKSISKEEYSFRLNHYSECMNKYWIEFNCMLDNENIYELVSSLILVCKQQYDYRLMIKLSNEFAKLMKEIGKENEILN